MIHYFRTLIVVAVAAAIAPFAAEPVRAQAQTDAAAREFGAIEEIVVTSRRRQETLQDIPTSIASITANQMQQAGILDVEAIGEFVPNLAMTTSDRSNNTRIVIRGIGGGFPDPTQVFGTGLYINGTYIPNSVGGYMSTLDIERVEVLRGPQGTLFGKNTTGGAVNVIVRKPQPVFEASALARAGRFGRGDGRAMINFPVTDEFFLRISGAVEHLDGYYKNTTLGTKESGHDTRAVTGAARWVPNENLTVDATVQYSIQEDDNKGGQCDFISDSSVAGKFSGDPDPNTLDLPPGPDQGRGPGGSQLFRQQCDDMMAAGDFVFFSEKNIFSDVEQLGLFGDIVWDSAGPIGGLDNFNISVSGSYRSTTNDFLSDRDYSSRPLDAVGTFGPGDDNQKYRTINFETIINAVAFDGRVDFVAGYNFFDEKSQVGRENCHDLFKAASPAEREAGIVCDGARGLFFELAAGKFFLGPPIIGPPGGFPPPVGPPTFATNIIAENKSHGAFAHGKFSITEKLTFETGVRYTSDKRKFRNIEFLVSDFQFDDGTEKFSTVDPVLSARPDGLGGTVGPLGPELGSFTPLLSNSTVQLFGEDSATFDNWTPKFVLSYDLPEGVGSFDNGLVYASVSKGFLTGGFNTELANEPELDRFRIFGPEKVWTYEIGAKSQWFGRRLQANISLFYSDYSDRQEQVIIDNSDGGLPGPPDIQIVQNVATVEIMGFEFESQARPWRGGLVSFDVAYLDNKFDAFDVGPLEEALGVDFDLPEDAAGVQIDDFSADWTISGRAQHTFSLRNGGLLTPQVGFYYQSGFEWEDGTPIGEKTDCFQEAYSKWNARLTWENPDQTYQVAVFGHNIFDKRILEQCDVNPRRGWRTFQFEQPATFGFEVSARWGG